MIDLHLLHIEARRDLEDVLIRVQVHDHRRRHENLGRPQDRHEGESDDRRCQSRLPAHARQDVPTAPNTPPMSHVGQAIDVIVSGRNNEINLFIKTILIRTLRIRYLKI